MGLRVKELRGRELEAGDALSTSRKWQVRGTNGTSPNEEDVYGAITGASPTMVYLGGAPLVRATLTAQETGLRTWDCLLYTSPSPRD